MDTTTTRRFSIFGMDDRYENGVFYRRGYIWGKLHSNGNINISSSRSNRPVFHGRVTTSGRVMLNSGQTRDYSQYDVGGHPEEHMPTKEFPDNISEAVNSATNKTVGLDGGTDTRNTEIWVELNKGTSADDDGYAIIRKGSFTGTEGRFYAVI